MLCFLLFVLKYILFKNIVKKVFRLFDGSKCWIPTYNYHKLKQYTEYFEEYITPLVYNITIIFMLWYKLFSRDTYVGY